MAEKMYFVDEALLQTIRELRQWQRNFRVTGAQCVTNGPTSCSVVLRPMPRAPAPQAPQQMILTAQITGAITSSAGMYNAKLLTGPTTGTTGNLSLSHWGTLAENNNAIVWDMSQTGITPARPLTGLIVRSAPIGTNSGSPILVCASAVQKMRINSNQLQVSYLPNPASTDWVNAVTGVTCT